ncbi:MAG: phosphotransacetylase family protein [Deltaproteobacteria bacterium]|nr:phosphotransacetylase family protein [Deltaproteobacteria bacterium]
MVPLYITSTQRYAGKKLLTMGLMDRFRRDGFKVGYFQPMGHFPIKADGITTDKSAWLIYRLFALEDPLEMICPVVLTRDLIMKNLEEGVAGMQQKMEDAFEKISQKKDVVVVGCDNTFSEGSSFGVSGVQLVKVLDAYALFIESYVCEPCIDLLLELKKVIGNPMIGVVFNRVAPLDMDEIKGPVIPFLSRNDVEVYGSVPWDTLLGSLEVSDLADHLGADVVCGKDNMGGLVENFLVGGMQVDKFISYLLKSPSSGIIVGGDRTDIQLVAIENGVRCLILSGNLYPNDMIVARAETKGVPILVVRDDTYTVAKNVKAMVGQFKLGERDKINHGMNLVDQVFDFEKLYKRLNLVP